MSSLEREIVWLGHSNESKLLLLANDSAVELSGATAMTLNFNGITLNSTNGTAQCLTWNKAGYATGEVHMHLGQFATLVPGNYDARIVVYDAGDTTGIVWGDCIPICIKAEIES